MGFKQEEESRGETETIESPNEEKVKIDLEPEDKDDGDDEPPRAAKGDGEQVRDPKTGQWSQKKRERAQDNRAKKAWEVERESMERRLSEERASYERRIKEVEDRIARSSQPQGQQADPFDAKLADIEAQLEAELKLIESDDKRGYKRYNELRRQEQEALVDKKLAIMAKGQK